MKRFMSFFLAMVMLLSLLPAALVTVQANQIALYWPLPVDKVAIGRITSKFGPRTAPTAGASTNHRGVDMPAASGTAVYAAFDGVVTSIGYSNARGNYVVIYHELIGLSTLYQHLTCATVQLGETVVGGTQVAISGNTGVGTGAHLHFGVMVGKATNPNHDQPAYNMAIDPLGSNIVYVAASGAAITSDNPDDYPVPTRDLFYTSPVKTGNDVRWVQAVLFKLGYTIGIDGSFGPATESVVKQFQADYGLTADGSVGPATRAKLQEAWNNKKNGVNVQIELHSWLATTEYGDTPSEYYVGDRYYLCYELIDAGTGQKINSLVNKNYTVVMAYFNTDGSVHSTVTLASKDAGVLAGQPMVCGTYLAAVAVVGDITLNSEIYFQAVYNTKMTSSLGSISLDLTGSNTATTTLSLSGAYPAIRGVICDVNPPIATATPGTAWDGGNIPITVTGISAGNATLTLSLIEGDTGTNSTIASITVPVTVSAPTYSVTYNANGGSGAPSAQTKTYGNTLTLSSTVPTRNGYTFKGWSTSSTATTATYQPGATYNTDANLALYAVWEQDVVLSSISIGSNPTKTTYYVGDTFNSSGLSVKLTYSNGTTQTVTTGFTTSGFNSSTSGNKTITVTYGGKTATFNITVKAPTVTLSQTSTTTSIGDSVTLTATTDPAGKSITWTSSTPAVAAVSNGTVTGKSCGTATITAKFTYNNITYSKTCNVVVDCEHKSTTTHPATASTCKVQGNNKYVTCNDCGEVTSGSDAKLPLADHTGGTATCNAAAVCIWCGQSYGSVNSGNHVGETEIRDAAPATETANGYTGDTYCTSCGVKIADGEIIPMLSDPGRLMIPEGTTVIAKSEYAFNNDITSVIIPEGVTVIEKGAFTFCENLRKVVLPSTLETIEDGAFAFCYSLSDINIPTGLTTIGNGAFGWCTSLDEIMIPDAVTTIGDEVFEGCAALTLRCYRAAPVVTYAEENDVNYRFIISGDADDDGIVSLNDFVYITKVANGAEIQSGYGADADRDGAVNLNDVTLISKLANGAAI